MFRRLNFASRRIGDILYVRIGVFDINTSKQMSEVMQKEKDAKALILDLRGCSAGDWAARPESFRTLLAPSALHTAILLGPGTHGAGEILGAVLIAAHRGIGIGAPTAGSPYPRKTVAVSSGKWLVPMPPEGAETVHYEPLVPQIRVAPSPRISIETLKKADDLSQTDDRVLSRASDLLISLNLLERKGLKK